MTMPLTRLRKFSNRGWFRIKITRQTILIHQRPRILLLWTRLTRNIYHLEGGHYEENGGMWTLKHEISSPKFYGILIKTDLRGDTDMDLNNFYIQINVCLNAVTRLREELLPSYKSIKINSDFREYFVPYRSHPSYYWN